MKQICAVVQMFFMALALSAIGSVIMNIDSLSGLGSLMSLAGSIMSILSIYRLRHENRHFAKTIRLFWAYIGLTFVVVILAASLLVSMTDSTDAVSIPVAVAALVLAVAVLVLALVIQYQIYSGFDELRELRAIDYPPRRIMWCFYIAIISMAASIISSIGIVILLVNGIMGGDAALYALIDTVEMASNVMLVFGVLIEAVHLWLVFTFMQAAKTAADNEHLDRWDSLS